MADDDALPRPGAHGQTDITEALDATIQALTQATAVLRGVAGQLSSAGPPGAGAVAGAAVTINAYEDDPFSERTPTPDPGPAELISEPPPDAVPPDLPWHIRGRRPTPGPHPPGSPDFRYWNAEASLARAVRYWGSLAPQGTRWSTFDARLPVQLDAGQDLNAFYSRLAGLRFFRQTVNGTTVDTGDSPDVIRHELGHAVLDAIRPELFDAASIEADAFHEAFGDTSALLTALERPSFRQKVLGETGARLNVNSRLSRIAEQLGWGIRQFAPQAVDRDCLRNAANRFAYRVPATLPPEAPATELSTGPHSFSRVFTGAVLDALAAMLDVTGSADEATLETVGQDLGQLLVDGVLAAPIRPTYFSQVAAAMVQAAKVRNDGRYRSAVLGAFVGRGVLDLVTARALETAPLPRLQAAAAGGAPAAAGPGTGGSGSPLVLAYGGTAPSTGYRADATSAPGLPLQSVRAEFLDQPVLCHAPAEGARFSAAPAVYGPAAGPSDATDSARHFLATLVQLGRIDPGPAPGMVRGPSPRGREARTHRLEPQDQGLVLKRIQFQCACRPLSPGAR
ncbi:hypothetical protein SAMN06893096_102509 [Geodermatophilus pulveris]|uniref:Fungalysin metallopeptidase (M36) n=1 Tax=Geodermatophilus pulveris TaxID=1564159 RepID=A0A239CNC2_9ACTN|nr:hypothetical protein [Geodermatophilus pulveris]SNS20843.1 hypothetical protein SAMN06893096_102509 [Geodermatophilus pulveris]